MRSANQAQIAGSILVAEYFGISSPRVLRKLSVVKSLPAKPMMANCLERRLSAARLHSAGISLRLVRSPVAPKITITQGAAIGFSWTWLMRDCPFPCQGAFQFAALRRSRFLFRVAAELEAHGRQNLGGKVAFASRQESLVERFGEHGSGRARLDSRENGPAAFARIGNAAGETLERRLLKQGNGGEIQQPGCHHTAAPPDFRYVGETEIVLVVLWITQWRVSASVS